MMPMAITLGGPSAVCQGECGMERSAGLIRILGGLLSRGLELYECRTSLIKQKDYEVVSNVGLNP
jgi:hypothetical protein